MSTFGITANKFPVRLGGLSTQAMNYLNNSSVANVAARIGTIQNIQMDGSIAQQFQTNSAIIQVLPPVLIKQNLQTAPFNNIVNSPNISNVINSTSAQNIVSNKELLDPVANIKPRNIVNPTMRINGKSKNSVGQIKEPNADTLKLSEIKIENDSFVPVNKNGISIYRPEILGMIDFNPIFFPENKNEFTEHGQFLSINYQSQILRKNTLDKIIQKIKESNNRALIQPLVNATTAINQTFAKIDDVLTIFINNFNAIKNIASGFNVKNINKSCYDIEKFLPLKQFFEKKMQYSENSYTNFSDTKILMQLLLDLKSSLEGYSFSLLSLEDIDRKNDLNPIILDKTFTRNNNFAFSIESIKTSGPTGRLSMDVNEFTQFVNSLPNENTDKLKLLLCLLSKELRISRGLSKQDVRNTLTSYYLGLADGNPFDNIVGNSGNDIFESTFGINSLIGLLQLVNKDFIVLPFETKTVDDSQTTYIPGSSYFTQTILNDPLSFNLKPYNSYIGKFSDVFSKANTTIQQLFDFEYLKLLPEEIYLNFLQAVQDSVSSIGNNSVNLQTDQLVFAAIIRLANTDNILKLMVFQFFLLSGIASMNKQDNKKIFERLIQDTNNQIRNFSYVRINDGDNPSLSGGLLILRPYLEKLAEDIQTKIFSLINPASSANFITSPILRTLIPPQLNAVSNLYGEFAEIPFGVLFGNSNRINPTINSSIQSRTPNNFVQIGVNTTSNTIKGSVFDRNTIKNVLLSALTATESSTTNLLKEFVDLSLKLDNETSIQGNKLSYVLENNSTRFNSISTSYLLLFIFEIIASLLGRFFSVDFTSISDYSKIGINYDDIQNRNIFEHIKTLTSNRKHDFSFQKEKSKYFSQNLDSTPPALKNVQLSPSFLLDNKNSNKNSVQNALSSLQQTSINVFGDIGKISPTDEKNANKRNLTSISAMLEGLSNINNQSSDSRVGSFNQRIGFAGALTRDFQSPTLGIESIKSAIDLNMIPAEANSFGALDQVFLRKILGLKQNIDGIKEKLEEEDKYIKNSLHIFEVIADNLSLTNAKINTYFSSLDKTTIDTINRYKNSFANGQIKTSSWIQEIYKENNNTFGSFNSVYKDEYFSLISLLSGEFYTNMLAKLRLKLFAIGIPAGFSEKLIDRINKSNINNSNYKSFENDVISINVYKKNVENDDIVYYPQKFYFDLSLYPKEINNLNINPKMSFERLLNKFSLYDFSILGKNFENIIDLSNINQSDKYSFLTKEEKKSMFENHIVSNLLQTYIYLLTGISFSEEVFPTIPYDEFNLATTTTNQNTELLLRAYFKAIMNFDYPSQNNMLSALTDPAIPDSVKDDMQLLLYGTNMLRPNLILSKVLETKKFDRILIIPVNIDNFGINVNQTSQTTGGKRFVSKNSYQKKLTKIKIGNNELIQENRDKNSLIFEDYFVSIDTITKEE